RGSAGKRSAVPVQSTNSTLSRCAPRIDRGRRDRETRIEAELAGNEREQQVRRARINREEISRRRIIREPRDVLGDSENLGAGRSVATVYSGRSKCRGVGSRAGSVPDVHRAV